MIQPRERAKQYKINLTVPVGKGGESAALWKSGFLGMARNIQENTPRHNEKAGVRICNYSAQIHVG